MAGKTVPHSIVPHNDLTKDFVEHVLDYDPLTGVFRWKSRNDIAACVSRRIAGKIAGKTDPDGYNAICIRHPETGKSRLYYGHRLAWLIAHGSWPADRLDHVNGNKRDNRVENLRAATASENSRNSRCKRKGRLKGITFNRRKNRWIAQIILHRQTKYLGAFDTPEEAHAAYCEAAKRLHGEFARLA